MIGRIKLFILCLLLSSSTGLFAQTPTVKVSIDTSETLVGDQMKLQLEVQAGPQYSILWPVLKDSLAPGIEILSIEKLDTLYAADKKRIGYRQTMHITCFDSGVYEIPSVVIQYCMGQDTTRNEVASQPIPIRVQTVAVDTTKAIKDIKGIAKAPLTWLEILEYFLIALGAVVLVLGLIYIWRKVKKKEPLIKLPVKPKRPAHEIALENLEKLRVQKLWQEGKVKEYHSILTDIVRTYIHARFDCNAMEMVSEEILEQMQVFLDTIHSRKLEQILKTADMVKFAKAEPLPAEHDASLGYAVELITYCIPKTTNDGSVGNDTPQHNN